jgi:hypothetical protein
VRDDVLDHQRGAGHGATGQPVLATQADGRRFLHGRLGHRLGRRAGRARRRAAGGPGPRRRSPYLGEAPPAAYTVFPQGPLVAGTPRSHGVRRDPLRRGRVIEQKNGLLETDVGLAEAYPRGTVKPVGDQARRSLEGTRETRSD